MLTGLSDASYPRAARTYLSALLMGTTVPLKLGLAQYAAQHPSACGAFEQIAALVGALGFVADLMRQCDLRDLARKVRAFRRPVAKGAAETVIRNV